MFLIKKSVYPSQNMFKVRGLHSGRLCLGLTQIVSEKAKKFDPNLSLAFLIKGVLIKKACNRIGMYCNPAIVSIPRDGAYPYKNYQRPPGGSVTVLHALNVITVLMSQHAFNSTLDSPGCMEVSFSTVSRVCLVAALEVVFLESTD